MWIGTEGGRPVSVQGRSARSHFEKGSRLLSDWIRTLYLDAQGTLWIGTAGGGLSRWRDGQLATFTTREGLPDNTISQILEDDTGRLWLGSNRGIACVSKRELEELAAGKIAVVYPQVYGRAEGMPSEECTGGFYPAGLKTKSGRLCFLDAERHRGRRPAAANRRCAGPGRGAGGNHGGWGCRGHASGRQPRRERQEAQEPTLARRRTGEIRDRPGQTPAGISLHGHELQLAGAGALSLPARSRWIRIGWRPERGARPFTVTCRRANTAFASSPATAAGPGTKPARACR